jgi:hypothetical protein
MQIFILTVTQQSTPLKTSEVSQILAFAIRNRQLVRAQARAGTERKTVA